MRFFGAKLRESHNKKRDGQQHHPLTAESTGGGGDAEVRTDATTKKDRGQQQQAAKDLTVRTEVLDINLQTKNNGLQHIANAPLSRVKKETSPSNNSVGRSNGGLSPRSWRAMMTDSNNTNTQKGNPLTVATAPELRLAISTSPCGGDGVGTKVKAAPTSILLKKKHISPTISATNTALGRQQPPSIPPTTAYDISPPPLPTNHNPPQRVRFMSAGSVASTEASQVHLMAGAAGSVASSSAMSSADNRDNVFDRVLHMVMAEEHERLAAMGMSRADPKSDVAKHTSASQKRGLATIEAKTKVTVTTAGDNLIERQGPIDLDTGGLINGAGRPGAHLNLPLELVDTGMDVEYHDRNDDGVDEERWTRLNEAALASGMQDLAVGQDSSSPTGSADSGQSRLRRGVNKMKSSYQSQQTNGKKTKKSWGQEKHFQPDEWVAFDSDGPKRNEKRSGRNDLASF
jgi:hypothetical protein